MTARKLGSSSKIYEISSYTLIPKKTHSHLGLTSFLSRSFISSGLSSLCLVIVEDFVKRLLRKISDFDSTKTCKFTSTLNLLDLISVSVHNDCVKPLLPLTSCVPCSCVNVLILCAFLSLCVKRNRTCISPGVQVLDLSWNTLILKQIGYNKWITERDVFSVSDADGLEDKLRVLLTGVEPMTFWLLVQMLYHWVTGDSWELKPLN